MKQWVGSKQNIDDPCSTSEGGFSSATTNSTSLSVLQSEKLLLFDTVQSELEEKIRRLEEDRHSIDITSGTPQASLSSNDPLFNILSIKC